MARVRRMDVGGTIYHALNRANFRSALFKTDRHYRDFLAILEESLAVVPMRILAYCLMPNHWHLVLYPRADGDLARFLQRIRAKKVPDPFSPRKGPAKETAQPVARGGAAPLPGVAEPITREGRN